MTNTIDLTPSWESLHRICKDGEFPGVYKELLKPCLLADEINKLIKDNSVSFIKIYAGEDGELLIEGIKE